MRVECEICGVRYHTNENKYCPICGSPDYTTDFFDDDDDYLMDEDSGGEPADFDPNEYSEDVAEVDEEYYDEEERNSDDKVEW